eukprot:COSAG04_NODE_515_length_13209_cov_19.059115_17_plen_241_part_00
MPVHFTSQQRHHSKKGGRSVALLLRLPKLLDLLEMHSQMRNQFCLNLPEDITGLFNAEEKVPEHTLDHPRNSPAPASREFQRSEAAITCCMSSTTCCHLSSCDAISARVSASLERMPLTCRRNKQMRKCSRVKFDSIPDREGITRQISKIGTMEIEIDLEKGIMRAAEGGTHLLVEGFALPLQRLRPIAGRLLCLQCFLQTALQPRALRPHRFLALLTRQVVVRPEHICVCHMSYTNVCA